MRLPIVEELNGLALYTGASPSTRRAASKAAHTIEQLYEALADLLSFSGANAVSSLAWHRARTSLAKARGEQ